MVPIEIAGPAVPRLSRAALRQFVRDSLRHLGRAGAISSPPEEISIALVSDATMASLNRRFRKKNHPTDVLTFPGSSPEIVISLATAKRQASAEGHSLATEIRYLLLHGLIHSFGYDHETDDGEMNALELKIREEVGL